MPDNIDCALNKLSSISIWWCLEGIWIFAWNLIVERFNVFTNSLLDVTI